MPSILLASTALLLPYLLLAAPDGAFSTHARTPESSPVESASVHILVASIDSEPLDRIIRLSVRDATVHQALDSIEHASGLSFNFEISRIDAVHHPVSFSATRTTVARALGIILRGTGLEVQIVGLGRVVIAPIPDGESRLVTGRVVDATTTRPVPRAEVWLNGLWHHAYTSDSGTFRLDSVPPGTFSLMVRSLGYTPIGRPVKVTSESVALLIGLQPTDNALDRVIVTGTATPTPTKALPSPITVIAASDLTSLGVTRLDQVFQGLVPGAISWDQGNLDYTTAITVRGASSLGTSFIKTYIDGVEVANSILVNVDVHSIDHIEIIRGPEASTIYGSDASGGVMQIFTKKGYPTSRPVIDAEVGEGVIQNPTANTGALRQNYAASITGGTSDLGYNMGASYHRTGAWIPYYSNSDPSVYGGARLIHNDLQIDISARYSELDFAFTNSPALVATGIPQLAKPENEPSVEREETYGAHLVYTPIPWWDNSLTIGSDRSLINVTRTKPQIVTPGDSLPLNISNAENTKASVAYNTTLKLALSRDVRTTITLGIDHYIFNESGFIVPNSSSVTGQFGASNVTLTSAQVENTGYFGQVIIGLRDVLFLTGGLRAETNSAFGPAYGTSLNPRVGLAYNYTVGPLVLKPRIAYGEGIRAPEPGLETGSTSSALVQLANPYLGPERQSGFDGGIDAEFGKMGSIGVTYYNQIANDLIEQVVLSAPPNIPTEQNQNVGKIHNTGWEFEGALMWSRLYLHGTFSVTYSTIEDLGPNYTGDYRPGDQVRYVPKTSGGLAATYKPWPGGEVYGQVQYVGRWTGYDATAFDAFVLGYSHFSQTPSFRVFWESFPAFGKGNVGIHQSLSKSITLLLDIYNVTNNPAVEQSQQYAPTGRTTVLRLAVHY